MVKCDTSSLGDGGGGTKSRPFLELLLCGVTKGKVLLPVHFPLCWALPRRQGMLGQAQFSLGIFRRWKQSQREVSSHRREAGNASSIISAQGRRCMRFVTSRCLWKVSWGQGRDDVIPIGGQVSVSLPPENSGQQGGQVIVP